MQTELRLHPAGAGKVVLNVGEGQELISLAVPAGTAQEVADAVRSVLALAGHSVRLDAGGGECAGADALPVDATPAMRLRGLRGREGLTQAAMAARLGISQNMVSVMESGKRSISVNMARRIGLVFQVPYRLFL